MAGSRIRLARDVREMSQADLARQTGVSIVQICRYERDERQLREPELQRIAEALRSPVRFFQSDGLVIGALGEVQFRKKSATLASQRRKAVAEMNCGSLLADQMSEMLAAPRVTHEFQALRPSDYNDSPAFAAYSVARAF